MNKEIINLVILAILFIFSQDILSISRTRNRDNREGKFLSFISVVKFDNDECLTSSNQNGTCFTAEECTQKEGIKSGSCAQGYGVCCLFEKSCGTKTSQNLTYFTSKDLNANTRSCKMDVCKANENVSKLRLDFDAFRIGGPVTKSTQDAVENSVSVTSNDGLCLNDFFSVTCPGMSSSNRICGQNEGFHLYVDASDSCNMLMFTLLNQTNGVDREWNIKVTQFEADFYDLPKDGCHQYFIANEGEIKTYNFDGGVHLSDQNQVMCFRQNGMNTRVCFAAAKDDFQISHLSKGRGFIETCDCSDQVKENGNDCLIIPEATKADGTSIGSNNFCGRALVDMEGDPNTPATICTSGFMITFQSDRFEAVNKETNFQETQQDRGLKLTYKQS